MTHNVRLVEAVLFAAEEPLSVTQIEQRLNTPEDTAAALAQIEEDYKDRGINLVQIGGKYCLRTAIDLAEDLKIERSEEKKLSRAAMETLSIVAYHQPVTRAEIENIRGVATSKGTLDILVEIGWVKPGRRRQVPGRPVTWITSDAFMDHFGLEAMTDLPGLDELKSAGLLDRRPAVDTLPLTKEMFEEDGDPEENAA